MWEVLLPDETTRTLLSGARFQIGRGSQNDYQINDNTVSKRHLRFSVELNQCNVTDLSQFGTNVNGVNIRKWCSLVLEKPNYIIVGKPEKTITVRYIPICICTSNFLKNDKIKIRNLCKRYGFQFTNQSEKCTHLVMKQIGVSIKFLLSLIEAKHIVSSNWLTNILHYQKTFEWPKEEENFPIIIEEKIITEFTPLEMKKALTREKRESLFEDLHFLFLNKENYNHSHQIIKSASGQTYIFNIDDLSNFMQIEDWLTKFIKNEKIFGAKLCVVVPEKSYVKRVNSKFESVLKKFQISTILEYEIGMAVILNSTEKYCSPPQPVINKKKINQKIILNTNENTQLIENLRNPDEDEDDDEVETDIEEDGKGRGEDEDEDGDEDEDEDEDEDDEGEVQVQEEETQIISNEYLHKFNSFNKIENNVKIKQTQILSNEGLNDLDNYSKYNEEYKLKRRRIISKQNNKRTVSNNNYSDSGNDTDRVNNKNDDDDDDDNDNDNDSGGGGSSGDGGSDSSSNNSRNESKELYPKKKKKKKKNFKKHKKITKKYKISKEKYDQFLVLKLMKGRNLAVRDVSGKSDPYVMLSIGKEQQYKSRIIKQNLNPVWNEIYVFGLKNLNTKVKLECWDWDRLSSDDEMGDKIINLSNEELKSGITATKWINLENVESGKIHISLTYYKIEGKKLVTEFDYQKEKKIGQVLRDKGLKVSMKQKKMISSRLSSLEKGTDLSGLTSVDPENPILTNQNASGQLDLEFIYGYRGQEGRTNIHFINLNEITYYASSIGIVLNTRTKKQRFFIGHHTGRIFCNDVHPDKKIVATAEETDQGKICLWSAETCELLATVDSPHNKGVMSIRFSNDGRRLLTVGMDENSTVCYWDITQNGKIVLLSKDSTSSSKILNCCFLYNDHTKFVTCGLKNLHFWEAQNNGSTLSKTPVSWGGNEPSLLLTIDATSDNHIITGSREGNIMIWSWSSRSEVERFRAHTGPCMTLKVKHEDGLIISGGKDGKINLWNASTFQREKRINSIVGGPIRAVDFIKGTAIVGTNKNQIWFTENVNSDKSSMLIFSHAEEIHGLTSHPTTQNFITGSDDRSVRVFSISSHKVINKKSINGQARCLAYSPNGKLISIGLRDGEILIVDSKLQQLSNKKEATSPPIKMLWAPNSSMLLISYHDGYLDIYNASSVFRRTTKIQLMAPSVFIDWSVDSKYFRVLENNQIVVYESEKGTKVTNLQEQIQWNSSSCEIAKEGNITTCLDSIHNWISYGKQNVLNVEHSPLNSSQPTVYRGHSVLVANLMYIQDKYLITVGGPDMCIFQWKII